jgi:hypothetical protein
VHRDAAGTLVFSLKAALYLHSGFLHVAPIEQAQDMTVFSALFSSPIGEIITVTLRSPPSALM